MTLAQELSSQVNLYQFMLKQPWQFFTPRRMPKFQFALTWKDQAPVTSQPPNVIITTGRKAAAVGKHLKDQLKRIGHNCTHLQILNPKDNLSQYDLVLIPQHDEVWGPNVINFQGSIHPFNQHWFKQSNKELSTYIAIILGNPQPKYFISEFQAEIAYIRSSFPTTPLYFCGSPRLAKDTKNTIMSLVESQDKIWLNQLDGPNPYRTLLKSAKKLFVSSDSINMINEACQSNTPVSLLASQLTPSPKHQRFIHSIQHRLCLLDSLEMGTPCDFALNQIKHHPLLQSTFK